MGAPLTLEQDLEAVAADVNQMQTRYQNLLNPKDRSAATHDEQSALLNDNDGKTDTNPTPYRPPAPSFAALERTQMDEQIRQMEYKLAKMKQDVAIMQDRYIKFAFGDYKWSRMISRRKSRKKWWGGEEHVCAIMEKKNVSWTKWRAHCGKKSLKMERSGLRHERLGKDIDHSVQRGLDDILHGLRMISRRRSRKKWWGGKNTFAP